MTILLDRLAALVDLGPALAAIGTTKDRQWPLGPLHYQRPAGEHLCHDRLCSRCNILRLTWRIAPPWRVQAR